MNKLYFILICHLEEYIVITFLNRLSGQVVIELTLQVRKARLEDVQMQHLALFQANHHAEYMQIRTPGNQEMALVEAFQRKVME